MLSDELVSAAEQRDPFCREKKSRVHALLTQHFDAFEFSKVLDAAYPLEPCGLLGLADFVREKQITHASFQETKANFTEHSDAVHQDRRMVQGLAGLLSLQRAKYGAGVRTRNEQTLMEKKAASKAKREKRKSARAEARRKRDKSEHFETSASSTASEGGKNDEILSRERTETEKTEFFKRHAGFCRSKERKAGPPKTGRPNSLLLEDLRELENVLWSGTGFPELHEVVAKAIGGLAETLQLQRLVTTENLETLHNLEPLFDPPTAPAFPHLSFPGLALRPYVQYEAGLFREWGDEFGGDAAPRGGEEELEMGGLWDPVKIALGYLDLVPYCDMQSQIVGSFLQAGFWFYKALQNLDESCGNERSWTQDFLVPELLGAPPEIQHAAMQYALKKAVLENLDTALQIANYLVAPNVRFLLSRTALRVRVTLLSEYGEVEDIPKLVAHYLAFRNLQRFQPLWRPPAFMVGDLMFADVLSARLQEAFLSSVRGLDALISPLSRREQAFVKHETDLLQNSRDFEISRYEAMEAALMGLLQRVV